MIGENPHIGSLFSDWLAEQGLEEDAYNHATKRVLAWQIEQEMKAQGISKSEMARRMGTSRAHLDRLLAHLIHHEAAESAESQQIQQFAR